MQDKSSRPEVPVGLGYALAMNNKALKKFAELSDEHRKEIISRSRNIASKQEMRNFVDSFGSEQWRF